MKKPALDMIEIPCGKHPAWQNIEERFSFEEDMRIHLYDALDNLNISQIKEDERQRWEKVLNSLAELGRYYKGKGYPMHIH